MDSIRITKEQARRFLTAYHGLDDSRRFSGKQGILEYVRRVGCIQFDPLNIVGHNQELVLQSRIEGFKPSLLQDLLYKDRLLMNGWDKVMSIYCTSDWPFFARYRAENLERLGNPDKPILPYLPMVRKELEERGPLSSIDLEFDQIVSWSWAPTRVSRAALESMYFWGELIIHHKVNTRKIYDFAFRHLPKELLEAPDPNETFEQYRNWRICRRVGGVGMLWAKPGDAWLEIPQTKTPERMESIKELLVQGRLVEVSVEDMNVPLYIRTESLPILQDVLAPANRNPSAKARIIAPLDNLLWDRKLILELFGFDYRWEVYKPQEERRYGYYVLPVLCADRFIARFEPSYDKKSKTLVIKNWWWEKGPKPTKAIRKELISCFRRFAGFLGAETVSPGNQIQDADKSWVYEVLS